MATIKRAFHDFTEWIGDLAQRGDSVVEESYLEYEHTIEKAKESAYMNRRLMM